jgi:hypothetical protein
MQQAECLKRPQLRLKNGRPAVLSCAAAEDAARNISCNVQIPLDVK